MDSILSANPVPSLVAKKPLIFVVDEDEDNILIISYIIEYLACDLIIAKEGQNIIDTATKNLPNLILLEILLPDTDGFELLAQLKQNESTNKIPIVVVTRLSGIRERERIESSIGNRYLCKPYLFEDLENLIRTNLNGSFNGCQVDRLSENKQ